MQSPSGPLLVALLAAVPLPADCIVHNRMSIAQATAKSDITRDSREGQNYVRIPAGTFQMGCSDGDSDCLDAEKPPHSVTFSKPFWLGQTEVTVGAYHRFAQATGRPMPPEPKFLDRSLNEGWRQEQQPIVNVTWEEAMAYCRSVDGHLATEAQWEYAARAGTGAPWYGTPERIAWFGGNSGTEPLDAEAIWTRDNANYLNRMFANRSHLHDVAQKEPNRFGSYDMLGNAWEWTQDWYSANYYRESPAQNPQGPPSGEHRVIRGGSWSVSPSNLRVTNRAHNRPESRADNRGFRCSREAEGANQ